MNIHPLEAKALKDLRSDVQIVIVSADKGRAAVVLDRLDYDGKINHLLTDEQTYQKLTCDRATALE